MDKYNEALEKAKLGLPIDEIFPELKESEDEKIMKEIIQFLRDASNSKTRVISSETLAKWAEFLEKRKDHKFLLLDLSVEDIETIKTALRESGLESTSNQKVYDKLEKVPASAYYLSTVGHSKLYPDGRVERHTIGYLEKQKEESKCFGYCMKSNCTDCANYDNEKGHDICKICEDNDSCVSPCCAKLIEKQKEQKPAEKQDMVAQLKEHLANTPREQLEAEWKELEKWNHVGPTVEEYLRGITPAEWSEEDERNLYNTIEAIKYVYDVSEGSSGSRLINWLKFHLRPQPHWKPSEKQMKALKVVARGFPTDDPDAIDSLLTDLQKLL